MSEDEVGSPAACGVMDLGALTEDLVNEGCRDSAEKHGERATFGDWRLVGSDGVNTQNWLHAPSGKINQVTVYDGGTLTVRNLRPGKGDVEHPQGVAELMRAGLIRMARSVPMSP